MLDIELEGQANLLVPGSSGSLDPISHSDLGLKEHNYLSLSECSSVDSSGVPVIPEQNKDSLNLKATELRLGLPGSQSPERDSETNLSTLVKLNEQPLFPLHPLKDEIQTSHKVFVQGNKRGFSDTVDEYSGVKGSLNKDENRMFQAACSDHETPTSLALRKGSTNITINEMLPNMSPGTQSSTTKDITTKLAHERPRNTSGIEYAKTNGSINNTGAPVAKEQVVGWPPIRSFRKNTLAITSKNNDEVVSIPRPGALFVKVSMDGAPYLRKVDIKTYCSYQELSSSLAKMFSCFTKGRCKPQGAPGKEVPTESKLHDLLNGSEYVLTYEDKDGDWMLVGDVPWEMFTDSCKRLKIMKGSDSIGLAKFKRPERAQLHTKKQCTSYEPFAFPRVMEKPKNGN